LVFALVLVAQHSKRQQHHVDNLREDGLGHPHEHFEICASLAETAGVTA
jgi:hypothetical protein